MSEIGARLRDALHAELPAAYRLRRELHAEPCLSGQEEPTLKRVLDALPEGSAMERVAGTGALLRVGGDGLAVGVRGELDALPIPEETGVPWASQNGAMHACGHDIHLAALVALTRAIDHVKAPAPMVAVLQPREEGPPSGARDIVESGALQRNLIGAMIAAHVQPVLAAGQTACTPGAVNASADQFTIIVKGQGGHAAYPHLARDPILALAQVIVAAQQLVSRDADPMTPTVVTFGTVAAGSAPNAIPGQAAARGTIRTMSESWRRHLHQRFHELAEGVARAYGCEAEMRITYGDPVLVNDARLAEETGCILVDAAHHMPATLRSCGADDFAHFASVVPSLMLFVGTDTEAGLHSPYFLPGDDTVRALAESLLAGYLGAAQVIGAG
ncbi:M20 metallopeptidase family protein [Streptosporangium amethystogenes]|uniref:M20 metallopeptidase family protein n=1 Tax=Streptosporangium amethystogenes TaxID=2002 RepID=UPI0004C5884F|nr:M20 family metallopeptidase [Streptosporangium amethystogenes]